MKQSNITAYESPQIKAVEIRARQLICQSIPESTMDPLDIEYDL